MTTATRVVPKQPREPKQPRQKKKTGTGKPTGSVGGPMNSGKRGRPPKDKSAGAGGTFPPESKPFTAEAGAGETEAASAGSANEAGAAGRNGSEGGSSGGGGERGRRATLSKSAGASEVTPAHRNLPGIETGRVQEIEAMVEAIIEHQSERKAAKEKQDKLLTQLPSLLRRYELTTYSCLGRKVTIVPGSDTVKISKANRDQ